MIYDSRPIDNQHGPGLVSHCYLVARKVSEVVEDDVPVKR